MKTYTITGLVDDQYGDNDLYVASVQEGRHEPAETSQFTHMEMYGKLSRFTGYFEADTPDEAERIAVDVVRHYSDDDAAQWLPRGRGRYRPTTTIKTDKT